MKIKHLLSLAILVISASSLQAATVTRDVPISGDINALVTSYSVGVIYTVAPVRSKSPSPGLTT